ncbi:MAG TPA: S8 family serine peptidase [Gaiellaceae bacterium]|jgi:subtilisin family serine protease
MGRVVCSAAAALVVALLGVVSWAPAAPKHPKGEAVPGELIVGFKAGASDKEQEKALQKAGVKVKKRWARIKAELGGADDVRHALKVLADDPAVRYAQPNYRVHADALAPADPSWGQLWGLANTGQTVNGSAGRAGADIDLLSAWDVSTGSPAVTVAVIDTGVDFSHPDLGAALQWTNPGELAGNAVDDDGNGYVDDVHGWDFVNHDADAQDDNQHGTHVTGTIAARAGNGVGVAGIAPGVKVMALKFLDASGSGSDADATSAILYAADEGAQIMSNSWGGADYDQALADAIAYADSKGALFVAAAGNDAADNDSSPHYPSSYGTPNVVSVAATDQNDDKAYFSNFGKQSVDLGAPGVNILSTVPGGGYEYFDGTSMATPHLSGAAALVKSAFPDATAVGIKALLMGTADPITASLVEFSRTKARLDAGRALACSGQPQILLEQPVGGFQVAVNEGLPVTVIATNCASPGATLTVTAAGQAVEMTPRGDGLYTGTFTPSAAGAVTLTATASVGAVAKSVSVGGSAQVNYRSEDAPYAWVDATAGGTNLGITGDDVQAVVNLPFAFSFYGHAVTQAKVGSNGIIGFADDVGGAYNNLDLPHPSAPNGFLAPFWDDLNPSAGGSIWTRTTGTAPDRRFVVEWHGVVHYPQTGNATFEAILEEGTNDVVYQWQDVNFGDAAKDYGAVASIGAENLDASVGEQFSYNTPSLQAYEGRKALRLSMRSAGPPPPPDTTAPAAPTGLVATAGSEQVTLDWADNSEADLSYYRVYRDGVPVATATGSSYTDTGLVAGRAYTYAVSAVDASRNESPPSASVSATPTRAPITVTLAPTATRIVSGSLYSGSLGSLASDDGSRYQVTAAWSGSQYVSDFYASVTLTAPQRATLSELDVDYDVSCTANASLALRVWNWQTSTWQKVDGWTCGTYDIYSWWVSTSPAAYVSASGEVRFGVRATRGGPFRTRTDLVSFTVTY